MIQRKCLINARGNLSQTEVAGIFGVKQQTYSHWEVGRNAPPPRIMKAMENYFGIPMEELFFDVFNSKNELKGNEESTAESA